jgi:effector-binding domain-containing protein
MALSEITMEYKVQLEQVSHGRPLAVLRLRARRDELSKVIRTACGTVWNALREQQVKGAGRHVALYLDDQINLEVGVEMDAPFGGHGEVVGSSLPAGLVAGVVHLGPYQKLHEAHAAIRDWCSRQQYTLAGPNWEIYGHWVDEWNHDPSLIRTDIFYLLKADTMKP